MTKRLFTMGALAMVIAAIVPVSTGSRLRAAGFGQRATGSRLQATGSRQVRSPKPEARSPKPAVPKTPWGDPDLQGTFTNKYEQSTPLERPDQFVGRRVEDVTGAELAGVLEKRQKQVLERPAGVGPAQFRDSLDVTKGSRAWLVVDPPDGRIPAMTPEAQRRIGPLDPALDSGINGILNQRQRTGGSFGDGPFDGQEDFTLWERCITRGLPGAMIPHILGNSYQIVQSPGFVVIRYELIHDARVIPLDGRPHAGKGIQLEMGDARGHWESDTLVIDTTNFKNRSTFRNASAGTLRLTERFTRKAPDRLEWAVTVDDRTTWTRPWTFVMPLTMDDREPVLEFACHEGNYAVPNILSAARTGERERAEAAATPR
jgi:hypothetical protein